MAIPVAMAGGVSPSPIPLLWSGIGCGLVALVFSLRAIGEFRYVGFFKRMRDSRFATLDTWAYSPLCLGLAMLIGLVAAGVAFGVR